MLAQGAKRCIAADLDPPHDIARSCRGLWRLRNQLLAEPRSIFGDFAPSRELINQRLSNCDWEKLSIGDPSGISDELEYHNCDATKLPIEPETLDFVVSNSFLEHIPDVDSIIALTYKLLRPGGFAVHGIDGIDHRHYATPEVDILEFLRTPGRDPIGNCNRIRPYEYVDIFTRHGFTVQQSIPLRRVPLTDAEIATFAEPWRSMPPDCLRIGSMTIVTRRPSIG